MWGRRQRCRVCGFEYPTDWWPMYSWGSQAAYRRDSDPYKHDVRLRHPYYRYGYMHPVEDPWKERGTVEWQKAVRKEMSAANTGDKP